MKALTGIPFFRIMIPFTLGILVGIKLDLPFISLYILGLLFLVLCILNYFKKSIDQYSKWLFIIGTDLFLLLFGIILVQKKDLMKQEDHYGRQLNLDSAVTFIAAINDLPVEKEKFYKCELKLLEIRSGQAFRNTKGTILGYFNRSLAASHLKAGETVLIKTVLLEVPPPKNPFEFDYKNYLYNKQIYHTAFIDSSSYAVLPVSRQLNPLWALGLRCKEFLLTCLRDSDLSKNAYSICAALLTGYDDDIDKSVMEAFSHSGTLHVLSVSGLHTGLIYLALNFLFNLLDRKKKYKLLRFVFITVLLWFFALITGFSAPVLRAVIMFNLLGFGKIYFRARYTHQINILLLSAFILLFYNPFYLMDVGFLLSYFALFGLIYFQPGLLTLWQPENKLIQSVWQSITASVAATISTLPITLFCFKQFPLWFFVCNIVVVPATFLLLILGIFVVFKIKITVLLTNYLVSGLIWFIELFNSKDSGFIDAVHFTFPDVMFLSVFTVLLAVAFQYRSHRQLALSLLLLIVWQIFSLFSSYEAKKLSLLTIYNVKNASAVSVKNKVSVSLSEMSVSNYNFSVKPHVISFNYPKVDSSRFNLLKAGKETVLFLGAQGFWPEIDLGAVTTLVLSNNFKLSKQDLGKFQSLKTLVVDASNNRYAAGRAEELSRNFGINFHNTRQKGAYLLALHEAQDRR